MGKHPNATVSLAAGSGFGSLIIWALDAWTKIPSPAAAAIAGGVSAVALFIGRNGAAGVWEAVKYGIGGKRPGR